ncbi:GumC family protein [Planctomycetota bacterium]
MDMMEKHSNQQLVQRVVPLEVPADPGVDSSSNLIVTILRRWYIVLIVFLVICTIGIPAVWFLIKPTHAATAAIRVAPIIPSILFSDRESEGVIPMYQNFMNTQADLMKSNQVLQRVADDLVDKKLRFFENAANPVAKLRKALTDKDITVIPGQSSELIIVTMASQDTTEAEQIVDAVVKAYMAIEVSKDTEGGDRKLTILESERKVLADKLQRQRQTIRQMAEEYGSVVLTGRQEMMLQRVADLQAELTTIQTRRITLETQQQLLNETSQQEASPGALFKMRYEFIHANPTFQALSSNITQLDQELIISSPANPELKDTIQDKLLEMRKFINADPTFQILSNNVTQLEQQLIVLKQTLTPTNPELRRKEELLEELRARLEEKRDELGKTFGDLTTKEIAGNYERKTELLEALKVNLEEKRNELGKAFDNLMTTELSRNREGQLANVTIELTQIADYEKRLQDMLAKENSETIGLGRKHLAIQDQQEQLGLTKELYDTVRRRIQQLEMERKRPARISIAYNASVAPVPNKRIKYIAALMFGSLAAGCFLALLMGKADHSLYTPNDITKRVGIRIIGTTTNADHLSRLKLPEQISCDYQAICANLGLVNGDSIPNKLVVTSPGMSDGKTTFAINLATSLTKVGKKILLIDGDLRKPDIQRMLNLPKGSRGLQEMLRGKKFEKVVQFSSAGFDVLTANSRNMADAFTLLSQCHISNHLNTISTGYDHVIIDTPPVLAFPDALLWAKIADGVILTSFSGHTTGHDLRETLERLEQIKVKVLGTVFHNVSSSYSYNRYAYGYYTNQAAAKSNHRKNKNEMLLMPTKEFRKDHKDSKSSQENIHPTDTI